jgi:multidrug transporter EmrE-like cation transporter
MTWFYLALAIVSETAATSALKASEGFTKWTYGGLSLVGYGIAFYLLAIVLETIPVGIAYAIWAGAGVCLVAIVGVVVFGQRLDWGAVGGIALIVAGVVVLNTMSNSVVR